MIPTKFPFIPQQAPLVAPQQPALTSFRPSPLTVLRFQMQQRALAQQVYQKALAQYLITLIQPQNASFLFPPPPASSIVSANTVDPSQQGELPHENPPSVVGSGPIRRLERERKKTTNARGIAAAAAAIAAAAQGLPVVDASADRVLPVVLRTCAICHQMLSSINCLPTEAENWELPETARQCDSCTSYIRIRRNNPPALNAALELAKKSALRPRAERCETTKCAKCARPIIGPHALSLTSDRTWKRLEGRAAWYPRDTIFSCSGAHCDVIDESH